MKIRKGFVSNSSSSSFIITDGDHPGLDILESADDVSVDRYRGIVEDLSDNATWNALSECDYEWDDFLQQKSFSG